MWKEELLKLDSISVTVRQIHVKIKVSPHDFSWFFTVVYASPDFHTQTFLWNDLYNLSKSCNNEWLVVGDFNEVFFANEELGGNAINRNRAKLFRNCLQSCGLVDLGFRGQKYTWTNKRYRHQPQLIFERLDKCVANARWIDKFPNCVVTHLPRTKSDHCPLLLDLNSRTSPRIPKPFRMEPMYCSHLTFRYLVRNSFFDSHDLMASIKNFQ